MAGHHNGRHSRSPRHLSSSTRPGRARRPQSAHLRLPLRPRVILVLGCLAALVGMLVSIPGARATSATSRFSPSADAYVSQAKPTSNFGTATTLRTDASPKLERSYLRFDVTQLPGSVTKATLRLYADNRDRSGYTVRSVASTDWSEDGITYANAPQPDAVVAASSAVARGSWTSVDVTGLVHGDGAVSLALIASGSSAGVYASRETATTSPQLIVETVTTAAADTTTTTATTSSSTTSSSTTSSSTTTTTAASTTTSTPPSSTTSTTLAPTTTTSPYPSGPCGTTSTPPATYQHVVWIVMENKTYSQIIGSSNAPYINKLADQCGLATSFYAETHPSLPNYIAMTSGSTQGITDDNDPSSHPLTAPSIFSQLNTGWRSLQESMPSNCYLSNSGQYAVKHNPAAYFTNIRTQCGTQDEPLTDPPDLSAKFTFITPNMCDDMHSCSVATGDSWLATWMPKILNSSQYQSGSMAVLLTWDEDDYSDSQHIATLVISPSTPAGTKAGTSFNHYSMLRTTEQLLGITTYLGNASTAASMRHDFNL
jgi:phosphatidylinositol-3-phosphatase